ncbi:MAG: methyltransferase [Pricia sp.]
MKQLFRFKQFGIHQDRCAMKIGTDGVLLGGWTSLENHPETILDIGAGTGLIALMLAQRSNAETVDAIEIDEDAFEQCVENFEASPWGDRLFCYHAGLDEFVVEWDDKYDLIVSNPPFFQADTAGTDASRMAASKQNASEMAASRITASNVDTSRRMARFNDFLPFESLLDGVSHLLSPDGVFTAIIPYSEEDGFLALASERGLHPQKLTRVRGNPTSKIKRSLLQFGFTKSDVNTDELVIELQRHEYTEEYRALTKDFYLKV